MFIYERMENYRIVVDIDDLLQTGQSIDGLITNLKEASSLVGKPLGKHTYTYNPENRTWEIFITKEI